MTVLENLYVPALAMGGTNAEVHGRAMDVLDFLTMAHLRNEYAQALSGGQQKLLELGRLLMLGPSGHHPRRALRRRPPAADGDHLRLYPPV